jgi:hypothetical protein
MATVTAETVQNRKDRLEATKVRMAKREAAALESVRKAEEAIRKAQERLARAQAKVESVRQSAAALIAKRTEEVRKAEGQLAKSSPPAVVRTADGKAQPVTTQTVDLLKRLLGRKRKGFFSPEDGGDGETLLAALDSAGPVGDSFTLSIRGRKTLIRFAVQPEGLRFETVTITPVVSRAA